MQTSLDVEIAILKIYLPVNTIFILTVIVLLLSGGCDSKTDFDFAMDAYDKEEFTQALKLFLPLAESGNSLAQYYTGLIYQNQMDNTTQAAIWYKKAAGQDIAAAQIRLAQLYFLGDGVQQDYWETMKWSRKAAVQGNAEAEATIAYMYHEGFGIKQDYQEAFHWYTKAADKGWVSAMHDLGVMYKNGRGIPQDYQKAIFWYRKAAESGYKNSQDNLLKMYIQNLGIPGDPKAAFQWLLEAAMDKHIVEQYVLGTYYLHGRGVNIDRINAYAWMGIAAAGGFEFAQSMRDIVALDLSDEELDKGRQLAREFWSKYGYCQEDCP